MIGEIAEVGPCLQTEGQEVSDIGKDVQTGVLPLSCVLSSPTDPGGPCRGRFARISWLRDVAHELVSRVGAMYLLEA